MTGKTGGLHLIWEILFALLLLAVLVFTVVGELSRFSGSISYERVDTVTYTYTDTLTGYVFRDEIAPSAMNNGPVDYRAEDGKQVRAGEALAYVYRDDTGTDKRERAAAIYERIAACEAALASADTWQSEYYDSYTALMRELTDTSGSDATETAEALGGVIGGIEAAKSNVAANIRAEIDALRAQLQALTLHTNDPHLVEAEFDGTFYHETDGYEALFGLEAAATLTPAALTELLRVPAATTQAIGKLISHDVWYLAVPTTKALASTYLCDTLYTLRFENGTAQMYLERIAVDDTPDAAILIFRADSPAAFLGAARRHSVTVEKESVTGLCIPACAMNEDQSVYVLRDGRAWLCPVTPLLQSNGCLLLAPSTSEGTLGEGDVVILSERQLFPGKVLE